jgi:uroporphyrin-3 C-methyltransferase
MTSDADEAPPPQAPAPTPPILQPTAKPAWWLYLSALVAVVALGTGALLWQKVQAMQENLARQSADAVGQSTDAKTSAHQARDLAMETAAKLAVTDAKLTEVALQRAQVEELIQSLSRSRDENLVVDIEAAVRLAQQQAQLTGSIEPLVSALKMAEVRLGRAAQPRLAPLQRAIARDIARVQNTPLSDTPALLLQLDELVLLADELQIANAVGITAPADTLARKPQEAVGDWWWRVLAVLREEAKSLVRVSKITEPEAALLSPEQSFFVRENFKLRILNARLGLMARQIGPARADIATAAESLTRYFAPQSRKTQTAAALLRQVQTKMRTLDVPRVDETLAALSTAAAGR